MGRGIIIRVLYFSHLGDNREGKSYGGPHQGSHGFSQATVGVFGVVHIQGSLDTDYQLVRMSINNNICRPRLPNGTTKDLQECIQEDLQTSS